MEPKSDLAPLIVVVGETASGKSSLALALAQQFNGEIISADSWSVYKEFDIGTAKPALRERALARHYLLDVANPRDGFSAAEYKRRAKRAIDDIAARHKLPILVGGTGLYVNSVLFDYSFLPPSTPDVRAALHDLTIEQLLDRAELLGLNVSTIDIRNKRRIIRLIETNGALAERKPMRANTLVLGVLVQPEVLRERIIQRVDAMFEAGLPDEAQRLAATYGWGVEPMKGIGYREFYEYFNGIQSLQETRDKIIRSTLNLAKRQRTWFKRNKGIQWIEKQSDAVDLVTTFMNK